MQTQPSRRLRSIPDVYLIAPLTVLAVAFGIMTFTGLWPTTVNDYRSYSLQACAWLQGRLDLGQDYPWLELAIYEGKYYVSFPPFPSYVLLPFAAVFGEHTPDHWIALAVMLLGCVYAVRLCRLIAGDRAGTLALVLFLYIGNGYLFIGIQGWVWFLAQGMCFTLSLMALAHAVKGQGGISLACWACAVGCRPVVIVYLPLIIHILCKTWRERSGVRPWTLVKKRWYWAAVPSALALSYMALNMLRFGNPLEFGHNYLPEFVRAQEGQFSLSYVAGNVQELLRLPPLDERTGKLGYFCIGCMAFWLIAPIFILFFTAWVYALVRKRREHAFLLAALPVMMFLHAGILCMHRTLGGWQFGNRYLLDMLPYLFYGLLCFAPFNTRYVRLHAPLMALGAAINLIGTVAVYNKWI